MTRRETRGKRPEQQFKEYREEYDILKLAGTRPRGDRAVKEVFFTKKPGVLYAITPGWPGPQLVLKDVKLRKALECAIVVQARYKRTDNILRDGHGFSESVVSGG